MVASERLPLLQHAACLPQRTCSQVEKAAPALKDGAYRIGRARKRVIGDPMDIIIAESDAIRAHRIARCPDAAIRVEPTHEDPADFSYGSSGRFATCVLEPLVELGIIAKGSSVHLRFPHREARQRLRGITGHLCTSALPQGSCWRVIPEDRAIAKKLSSQGIRLFVDSPQLCVIHAAA